MPLEHELDIKQLEELLTELKGSASLSTYSLTLYSRQKEEGSAAPRFQSCCFIVQDPLCREASRQFFEKDLEDFFREGTHTVSRYGGGFFGFVVPFTLGRHDLCLVGDGVRDQSMDLWQLSAFSRRAGKEAFSLLSHVETLCTASFDEVDQVAREVVRCIEGISFGTQTHPIKETVAPEQTDTQLVAVAETLELLERTKTITETVGLCCETIGDHFQVTKMALALREANGSSYQVSGFGGLPDDLGCIAATAMEPFFSVDHTRKMIPYNDLMTLLPGLQATLCSSFPLRYQGKPVGFLALMDRKLRESELLLVSMLTNATAAKLARLSKDAEESKASALSGRLMSLANTLLLVDNKEQLYEAVLGIACDLIDATQGSIMLIDQNGENMHIVFTRGMTLNIARCLPIKVGKGIAGQVAQSGEPLLINDVEKDSRAGGMVNRARFKSKSLICIPLKLREKIIGVLNLSDKKNLAPFSTDDLQLLTSFANLASLMIERSLVLEQSVKFEQLSVTDSLTGLYNRRFLKSRLEEELNRSIRQGLNLTVLFIDLDFFKSYNDVCGHIAGDLALKKTADIIKASVREMDVVARYGGEEFCAVLPGTSKSEAMIVAERIREEIELEKFPGESDIPPRRITASLGVASFPEDGRSYEELVHASDVALYQAKANGRNQIAVALPLTETPPESGSITSPNIPENPTRAKTLDFNAYLEATVIPQADAETKSQIG